MGLELKIKDLRVAVKGKEILKGINLVIKQGEFHALMGPNGSGKSTLSYAIMGHPDYEVTGGSITYGGKDVLGMSPDERARLGMFLSFQHPEDVPGVPIERFLRTSAESHGYKGSAVQFHRELQEKAQQLEVADGFLKRSLNVNFSGGERKKSEMLQMSVLEPKLAILDETDSGLDVDALRIVTCEVKRAKHERPDMSVLVITHYQRILNYLRPDHVHVMYDGRIVESGGLQLLEEIERDGYRRFNGRNAVAGRGS